MSAFASRWVEPPAHVTERPGGGLAAGFRAAGVARRDQAVRRPRPRAARLLGARHRQRRPLHALGRARRARAAVPRALPARRAARRRRQLRQRERRDRQPRARGRRAHAGRRRDGGGRARGPGRGRVDRRDRRAAADGRRDEGRCSPRARELAPDGDAAFWRAIATTDAFEKLLSLDVALPSGTVRLSAQAKGAGMIQPGFATMLCFVQTDAALAAETADLLLGVCVKRSFDRISVDGQLSTNDTAILMASGASGVDRRARVRGRAALRRGARLRAAPARRCRSCATARARRGSGACTCTAATTRPSSGSRARSRTRRSSRPRCNGGDPNWGRIAQAVGAALPGRRAAAVRHLDRRRAGLRRAASRVPHEPPRLRRRGRVRRRAARRGRRDRGVLLRPLARLRDGSTRSTRHEGRRDTPRGAPVHPGVPRQDGRDQVRRRGDGGPARCARTSRATSCSSSTSG